MEKVISLLDLIFGCYHSRLSRVFTLDHRTYRVCCNCGRKFDYSLDRMRLQRRRVVV